MRCLPGIPTIQEIFEFDLRGGPLHRPLATDSKRTGRICQSQGLKRWNTTEPESDEGGTERIAGARWVHFLHREGGRGTPPRAIVADRTVSTLLDDNGANAAVEEFLDREGLIIGVRQKEQLSTARKKEISLRQHLLKCFPHSGRCHDLLAQVGVEGNCSTARSHARDRCSHHLGE